jgi:sRNA-binding protein
MTILNEQIDVVVARLAAAFPQTFVLEKHLPHRPLKVGVAADILAALPDLPRGVLDRALAAYTKRLMYLQAIVVGADRIDLDGNPAGQVTSAEAGHAIAVLVGIMAARAAQRRPVTRPVIAPAASPPPAKPADVVLVAAKGLKHRPVLHLGNAAKAKLPPGAQPT